MSELDIDSEKSSKVKETKESSILEYLLQHLIQNLITLLRNLGKAKSCKRQVRVLNNGAM